MATILTDDQVAANTRYVDKVAEELGVKVIELREGGDAYSFARIVPGRDVGLDSAQ